ncbi:MAG: hypothetical protein WBE58_18035 [Verrucomicrobiales bacterium]
MNRTPLLPLLAGLMAALPLTAQETTPTGREILIVLGIPGIEEYAQRFRHSAETWKEAAERGKAHVTQIGGSEQDASALKERIDALRAKPPEELWLILIGHGTFDGKQTKFAVNGPDFTDKDLAAWLKDFPRPVVVINGASSSAPFLTSLAGPDRVVITATKSAGEIYYARFGEYFATAISGDPEADLDNDEQVSLLEAYLYASHKVEGFYTDEGRIATEHALLDDNGDGKGARAEWFEGVRAVKAPDAKATPDGERAQQLVLVPNAADAQLSPEQRRHRDALEQELRALTKERATIGEEAFYTRAETLLRQLAGISATVKDPGNSAGDGKPKPDSPKAP